MENLDLSKIIQEDLDNLREVLHKAAEAIVEAFNNLWNWVKDKFEKVIGMPETSINAKSKLSIHILKPKQLLYCDRIPRHCRSNC